MKQWAAIFVLLTILSTGVGGLLGIHLMTTAEHVSEAQKPAANERPVASHYTGGTRLRKLSPVTTNLLSPAGILARVEASLLFDGVRDEEANVLAARVSEDIVAYLRSITLSQLEGTRGLQYLREDLNERASVRSGGKIRELIVETLVVQ